MNTTLNKYLNLTADTLLLKDILQVLASSDSCNVLIKNLINRVNGIW